MAIIQTKNRQKDTQTDAQMKSLQYKTITIS